MKRLLYFLLILLPALIAAALLFLGYAKIDTAMSSLLPTNQANNAVFQAVEDAQNRRFNETAVLIIGAENPDIAFDNAQKIAQLWRNSGLFDTVEDTITFNINDLIKTNQQLNVALLPEDEAQLLLDNPTQYFQQRAEDLANPFSGSLIPVADDWLGFGRFLSSKQGVAALEWSSEYNMLYSTDKEKTWVWLRANPNKKAIAHIPQLVQQTQDFAQQKGVEIAVSGGIFFAADSKHKAERESKIMSSIGLTLTFAFLLWAFRTPRILALLVVLVAGISTGLAVSLTVFSTVHILTIVVGTSLVGVLVDFPLHGLASTLFRQPENTRHAKNSIRRLLPTFAISLIITAAGYLLLLTAPLPLLKQTAVFSVAALFAAFLCTVFLLPEFLRHYQARTTHFTHLAYFLYNNIKRLPLLWISLICGVFLSIGIAKSQWQDDIRQWVVLPNHLLQQTLKVAQISGIDMGGQSLIIQAENEDDLLFQSREIAQKIAPFADSQGLHQWILPQATQRQLKQQLQKIAEEKQEVSSMTEFGISPAVLYDAMQHTAQKPDITLSGSLNTPLGQAWQHLYIGKVGEQHLALLPLSNIRNLPEIAKIVQQHTCTKHACVRLINKRKELNQQFTQIRNQTIVLKIISFVLAWLILWWLFGIRKSTLIIAIPTAAVLCTIGVFGWLNTPIGLFAAFGLLLSSAVGVDYAVYTLNAPEHAASKIAGITLAAFTTTLSFGLLSLSATPAVAAFGLSVAIAVLLNWAMCMMLIAKQR
ncbi:MAG: MMPL family transporter [Neisseriaceae bacterium]|nr:MMPL family transporter [Neisseriaceae bacterium]